MPQCFVLFMLGKIKKKKRDVNRVDSRSPLCLGHRKNKEKKRHSVINLVQTHAMALLQKAKSRGIFE